MTALTVEQVEEWRARWSDLYGIEDMAEVNAICDITIAALSERGGEPVGWLTWPDLEFVQNGIIKQNGPVSVQADRIPLFTRPQAGQEKIQPHHIAAVERAILDNEAQANRLIDQRDYSAEIPLDDAKSLREVLAMLATQGGSHG